jgi:predicted amidohydrolase
MSGLHVGAAQITARFGDFDGNLALIDEWAGRAAACGVEALLFSECVLHGASIAPEALAQALSLDSPTCRQIGDMARRHGLTLLVGFNEQDGDKVYNSQLIAHPDGALQAQRKHALNAQELANGLTPGQVERLPIRIRGHVCHIAICADWGAAAVQADLDRQGCELLFLPTAGGGRRENMLRAETLDTEAGIAAYVARMKRVAFPFDSIGYCLRKRRAVVTCNGVGDNGFDMCQEGHCTIMDRMGELRGLIPGAPVFEYQRSELVHSILAGEDQ